jgi:hypothetical protein
MKDTYHNFLYSPLGAGAAFHLQSFQHLVRLNITSGAVIAKRGILLTTKT